MHTHAPLDEQDLFILRKVFQVLCRPAREDRFRHALQPFRVYVDLNIMTLLLNQLDDFGDVRLEQADRVGHGEHENGNVVGMF